MGVQLVKASSQAIICTEPILTTRPMTWAMWYKVPSGSSHELMSVNETATSRGWEMYAHSAGTSTRLGWWTGSATQGTATAVSTRDEWNFVVARLISQSLKRISNLYPGGISHAQSTTSTSPVALTQVEIGGFTPTSLFMDGTIAEWWMADTDVQADGTQLSDDLLRQLAYRGPFSVPHVAQSVVEYRSFRSGIDSNEDRPGDVYQRGGRRQFTATNGPVLDGHPPIAADYVRPGPSLRPRMLVI